MELLLKASNERKIDIAPLREHSLLLRRKMYQVQVKLAEEFFWIKQAEDQLQDISAVASKFKDITQEIMETLQGHLTWLETNTEHPENTPVKIPENLQIEYDIVNFSSRAAERLTEAVEKTTDNVYNFTRRCL